MSTETDWYVYRGQQRWGPYTWQQLLEMTQRGQVQPSDQLWHPQYPNRISANQMEGLSQILKSRALAPQKAGNQGNISQQLQPQQVSQKNQSPSEFPANMITTALELPGYHIVRSYGIVHALVVPNLGYSTPLTALVAGAKGAITGPVHHALEEAYNTMIQRAIQIGANAIIGFRFTVEQIGCLAYGTAIWVEPIAAEQSETHKKKTG